MQSPQQKMMLYAFHLNIVSFQLPERGFIYFIWQCRKKQIQSLKYQSLLHPVQVHEQLTLNLKLQMKSSKALSKNTSLIIMKEDEEMLGEIQLNVSNWSQKPRQTKIPIQQGYVTIKMCKNFIMELENSSKILEISSSEEIQINEQGIRESTKGFKRGKSTQKSQNYINSFSKCSFQMDASMREEISRLKKQLEDNKYLNNKLKNDRDVLMSQLQQIEYTLQKNKAQFTEDLIVFHEHWQSKYGMTTIVYQNEIENIMSMIEDQQTVGKRVFEQIFTSQIQAEDINCELKNELYQSKQQIQILKLKNQTEQQLLQNKIDEAMSLANIKQQQYEQLKEELQHKLTAMEQQVEQKQYQLTQSKELMSKELAQSRCMFNDKQLAYQTIVLSLQCTNQQLLQQRQKMTNLQKKQVQVDLLKKQAIQRQAQMKGLRQQIQKHRLKTLQLQRKLQEASSEIDFTNETIKQLKQHHKDEKERLRAQIRSMGSNFKQINQQNQKTQQQAQLLTKLKQQLANANTRIQQQKREKQQQNNNINHIEQLKTQLMSQNQQLKHALQQEQIYNQQLKADNDQLKTELAALKSNIKNTSQQVSTFTEQNAQEIRKKELYIAQLLIKIQQLEKNQRSMQQQVINYKRNQAIIEYCDSDEQNDNEIISIPPKIKPQCSQSMMFGKEEKKYNLINENSDRIMEKSIDNLLQSKSIRNLSVRIAQRKHSLDLKSDYSGISYLKVTHTVKIRQLEAQIIHLKDQINKNQSQHIMEVQKLKDQIETANFQLQVKVKQNKALNIKTKNSQNIIDELNQELVKIRQQVKYFQIKIQEQYNLLQEKQSSLKLQETEKQLKQKQLQQLKNKISNNRDQSEKLLKQESQRMQTAFKEQANKYQEVQQRYLQVKMNNKTMSYELEQKEGYCRKLKQDNEQLHKNIQNITGGGTAKELKIEVEEVNRKNIDLTRNINYLKLEKENAEQELKIVKKKINQHANQVAQANEKVNWLERTIEETHKREKKNKRETEEALEDCHKYKNKIKGFEEEIQQINIHNSMAVYDKKKNQDQIMQLQEQISTRETELTKYKKQLQKMKEKLQDKEDSKLEHSNQLKIQLQTMEIELIKRDKRAVEAQEETKLLKNKLETLQKNLRTMQQANSFKYEQKLKNYVGQINNFKNILQSYENRMTHLKQQIDDISHQKQMIVHINNKLEIQCKQLIQKDENIQYELTQLGAQAIYYRQHCKKVEEQLDNTKKELNNIHRQLDTQHNHTRKLTEECQKLKRLNEQLTQQVNEQKTQINQFQTEKDMYMGYRQKYTKTEAIREQLQTQLIKLKKDYQQISATYVYKKEDVDKKLNQVKITQQTIKQQQIQAITLSVQKAYDQKIIRLQHQISQLLNENLKLRAQVQQIIENNCKTKIQLTQIKHLPKKVKELIEENQQQKQKNTQLADKIRKMQHQLIDKEDTIIKITVKKEDKQREYELILKKLTQTNFNIQQLEQNNQKMSSRLKETLKEIQRLSQKPKQVKIQTERSNNNHINFAYQTKIFNAEMQIMKMKQKEQRLSEEYTNKVRKLEQKISQMDEAMKQHESTLESHYQNELEQMDNTLETYINDLKTKDVQIKEMDTTIDQLQTMNHQKVREVNYLKHKLNNDLQFYNAQSNKLKTKLKEVQEAYNESSRNQSTLRHQLTMLKKSQGDKKTEVEELRRENKNEEKIKEKQKKIDELRCTITTLEQTVIKLKRKQNNLQKTKKQIEAEKEENLQEQHKEYEELMQQVKCIKQELCATKEQLENTKVVIDNKEIQIQSRQNQIKTINQLYSELQQEINKRKLNIKDTQSSQYKLLREQLIQKDQQYSELQTTFSQKQRQLISVQTELAKEQEKIKVLQQQYEKYKQKLDKVSLDNIMKKEINQLKLINEKLLQEKRVIANQIQKLKTSYHFLVDEKDRITNEYKQVLNSLAKLNIHLQDKNNHIQKYTELENQWKRQTGITIEEAINQDLWGKYLKNKDIQINQLIQQLEEFKFMQVKAEQLRRENYKLRIRCDENDEMNGQMGELHRICGKLQEERKNFIFKEEKIKIQLQSLIKHAPQEIKNKIQAILYEQQLFSINEPKLHLNGHY